MRARTELDCRVVTRPAKIIFQPAKIIFPPAKIIFPPAKIIFTPAFSQVGRSFWEWKKILQNNFKFF